MVLQLVLNLVKIVLLFVIGLIPNLSLVSIPADLFTWFVNIVAQVSYFLPIGDMLIMFGAWLFITNFAIMYNLVLKVWDALPFT